MAILTDHNKLERFSKSSLAHLVLKTYRRSDFKNFNMQNNFKTNPPICSKFHTVIILYYRYKLYKILYRFFEAILRYGVTDALTRETHICR